MEPLINELIRDKDYRMIKSYFRYKQYLEKAISARKEKEIIGAKTLKEIDGSIKRFGVINSREYNLQGISAITGKIIGSGSNKRF